MEDEKFFVHPKALVDQGAQIGEGTRVWAFAHVLKGAVIGSHCNIGDYAFVESGAKLGDHVTVKNAVQVWEGVTAENGVFLGPNCTLTNDKSPRSFIKKSKDQWLKPTLFKEGATIGANATVLWYFCGPLCFCSRRGLDYKRCPRSCAHARSSSKNQRLGLQVHKPIEV